MKCPHCGDNARYKGDPKTRVCSEHGKLRVVETSNGPRLQ